MKIHLGGTCGNSKWREKLIPMLKEEIIYINPVVKNWKYNEDTKKEKEKRIQQCDILLYVITPEQKGFSSIASAVDYSNKYPNKLIFCVLYEFDGQAFDGHMLESIKAVEDIIRSNNCLTFNNLEEVAKCLNDSANS